MNTAFLYTRVAIEGTIDNNISLTNQEKQLRDYCSKEKIKIIGLYEDCFSGSTFNRPSFNQLIIDLDSISNRPNLVLFTSWDRFSRNISETIAVIPFFMELDIGLQSIYQRKAFLKNDSKFYLDMQMVLPPFQEIKKFKNYYRRSTKM